jgi:hypothetical protein
MRSLLLSLRGEDLGDGALDDLHGRGRIGPRIMGFANEEPTSFGQAA